MPKVTNPLFSLDASGRFSKLILFLRGGRARKYTDALKVKPTELSNQQQRFQAITHLLSVMGKYGRGVLRLVYGPRWFVKVARDVSLNWEDAEVRYQEISHLQMLAWADYAPAVTIQLQTGSAWFIVCLTIDEKMISMGLCDWWPCDVVNTDPEAYQVFWNRQD